MGGRRREIQLKFRVTPEERAQIEQKMRLAGTTNLAAYLRKTAMDSYILRLELPELRQALSLLRRCSANLNQIAARVNSTGRVYAEDLSQIRSQQEAIWQAAQAILRRLSECV